MDIVGYNLRNLRFALNKSGEHDAARAVFEGCAEIERLRDALREIKGLLSYAGQDVPCEAVAQANKNQAWHIARKALDSA